MKSTLGRAIYVSLAQNNEKISAACRKGLKLSCMLPCFSRSDNTQNKIE